MHIVHYKSVCFCLPIKVKHDILSQNKSKWSGNMPKLSEAKKRANKKWNDANKSKLYDQIGLIVPKGKKEEYQRMADENGESLSAFLYRLINEALGSSSTANDGLEDEPDLKPKLRPVHKPETQE